MMPLSFLIGVAVSVFDFEWSIVRSRPGRVKLHHEFGICYFFAKYAILGSKGKDWLARNQENVSGWTDKSTRRMLFRWARTIKIVLSMLVLYKANIIVTIIISLNVTYSYKIAHFGGKQSLIHYYS